MLDCCCCRGLKWYFFDSHEVRGAYDSMPSQEEILSLADGSSLPGACENASQRENHEG